MEGNVTVRTHGILLQADRVTYNRATRTGEAEGNVLYVQGTGRVAGDRIVFNLESRTATMENATGYLEQGFIFRAEKIDQLDDDRIRFEGAVFTACTQPVPYWSFRVSSGTIIRDNYVHLHHVRLRAGKVPFFYLPYLMVPVKPDRASGLLMSQIGVSNRLGTLLSNAVFWDIARNQDSTFFLDLYSSGSVGGGLEHRYVPNARGAVVFNAYVIEERNVDRVFWRPEQPRWNVRFKQIQDFKGHGRLMSNVNLVSDGDYFLDFSRDIDRGSDPSALSRVEYIHNQGYTSLNLRLERREQFFTFEDVIQSRLPEVEARIRSLPLGKSPFYFELLGSASALNKQSAGFPEGAYGRVDLLPTISAPITPLPYLDITPRLRFRETYYSRALDPNNPEEWGDALSREFMQFDVRLLGPRFNRIFTSSRTGTRHKSTIEPQLTYRYQTTPQPEDEIRVPRFDEVDILPGDLNQIEYAIVSRLQTRRRIRPARNLERRAALPMTKLIEGEMGLSLPADDEGLPAAVENRPGKTGESIDDFVLFEEEEEKSMLSSPVEVASFWVRQVYSFENDLSFGRRYFDSTGDGLVDDLVTVDASQFSPVNLGARINPSPVTSVDLQVNYSVVEKAVSTTSLAAGLSSHRRGFLHASWVFRNAFDGLNVNTSQLRLSGGTSFFRHKVSLAASVSYDATLSRLQDQRYRVGYDTQCCGVAFEILDRNYIGSAQKEFRFVLNLRGIGNFLDLQGSGTGR